MEISSPTWFLLKNDDKTVFGPVNISQLKNWAMTANISPLDKVSTDNETWFKAPMVSSLEMDWLVAITANQLYGPTTIGAVQEFLEAGELSDETEIINTVDGTVHLLKDITEIIEEDAEQESAALIGDDPGDEALDLPISNGPVRTSIRMSLQQRIRDLEVSLLEERRALVESEERYLKLAARYKDATGYEFPG